VEVRPAEVRLAEVELDAAVLIPPSIPLCRSLPDKFNLLGVSHSVRIQRFWSVESFGGPAGVLLSTNRNTLSRNIA